MNRVDLLKGLIKEASRIDPQAADQFLDEWVMADKVMALWAERYADLELGDPPDEDEVFAVATGMGVIEAPPDEPS